MNDMKSVETRNDPLNLPKVNLGNSSQLYSIIDKEMPRFAPKGAAISMSPCLLANSFSVDFYQLYK